MMGCRAMVFLFGIWEVGCKLLDVRAFLFALRAPILGFVALGALMLGFGLGMLELHMTG